jgi:hypothetical protein
MPKRRWIRYQGRDWTLSHLATGHGLLPQTLASRLDRGMTLERALATGLCGHSEAGRRGSHAWRRTLSTGT